ncbi:hypothetical protein EV359DRAFT_86153 [Lentinula novae-zelandiae]|nr:hypothetical protein EV359DRAFT_86153 [Lentinula novae-zelandiae]
MVNSLVTESTQIDKGTTGGSILPSSSIRSSILQKPVRCLSGSRTPSEGLCLRYSFDAPPEEGVDTSELRQLLHESIPLSCSKTIIFGGGSARLFESYTVTPLQAIHAVAEKLGLDVKFALGTTTHKLNPLLDPYITLPDGTGTGALLEFWNEIPANGFATANSKLTDDLKPRTSKGAGLTRVLIWGLVRFWYYIVAWPVAKLLDWILGSNHGIIYRRVAIIGATLDLQEKVVSQAMTPLSSVFMLSIDAELNFDLLKKIVNTGHSRIPVYEEVDIPVSVKTVEVGQSGPSIQKVQKIIGILLVKQCVLLNPNDAILIRDMQLNKVPFIPQNESLLGILDKFQEGRSHLAIVSRFSVEKAKSAKKAVKHSLATRLKERVGINASDSDHSPSGTETDIEDVKIEVMPATNQHEVFKSAALPDEPQTDISEGEIFSAREGRPKRKAIINRDDIELDEMEFRIGKNTGPDMSNLMTSMTPDVELTATETNELSKDFDPAIMPLGIITLEDVLEVRHSELIGGEIYDEFDAGGAHGEPYIHQRSGLAPNVQVSKIPQGPIQKTLANVKSLSFFRSRSVPPTLPDDKETSTFTETTTSKAGMDDLEQAKQDGNQRNNVIKTTNISGSPLAIEALLLDRRRHLVAASTWTAGSSDMDRTVPKGKFKSGPIKKSYSHPTELIGTTPPGALPSVVQSPTRSQSWKKKDVEE